MLTSPVARQRMTQRADVERNAASTDAYGGEMPADFRPLATYPCFAWSTRKLEAIDAQRTAVVEDTRIMFPNGSDVTEKDRVRRVTDRRGQVFFEGPFGLQSLRQKQGWLEGQMELVKS